MIKDIDLPHVVQSHLINVTPTKETYSREGWTPPTRGNCKTRMRKCNK